MVLSNLMNFNPYTDYSLSIIYNFRLNYQEFIGPFVKFTFLLSLLHFKVSSGYPSFNVNQEELYRNLDYFFKDS